jgi:two-component system LytT family response regulator
MKKTRSVIIDDETANRYVLESLLQKHCPTIEIVGMAGSADEGYALIREMSPDLVFLDIKMPVKSGFDLLRMFEKLPFHIIFISAFDQYAINAFEFNAVDYVLKPIDHSKLIAAVGKLESRLWQKTDSNIIHFLHSIDEKSTLVNKILLHQHGKVQVVEIENIVYIQALRAYAEVVTADHHKMISSKTLNNYEELLSPFGHFIRVNKSVIVNSNHIQCYSKGETCFITMKNTSVEIEVSRRKKTSIIQYLKNRFDSYALRESELQS